jgi:hypothetical protein
MTVKRSFSMKIGKFLAMGAVWLLAAVAVPVQAQSGRPVMLQTAIPFDFVSGGRTLPAGRYSVEIADAVVRFLDANGHPLEVVIPKPRQSNHEFEQPRLVFHRYGHQCFLAQIWTRDARVDFRMSRSEKTLDARVHTPPEHLNIAMR